MIIEWAGFTVGTNAELSDLQKCSDEILYIGTEISQNTARDLLRKMQDNHKRLAVRCARAQESGAMPNLNRSELALLTKIGMGAEFSAMTPRYDVPAEFGEIAALAEEARQSAIYYARNMIVYAPHAVRYISELMQERYIGDVSSLFFNTGVLPMYHRKRLITHQTAPESTEVRIQEGTVLTGSMKEKLQIAFFLTSLLDVLGAAQVEVAKKAEPRNPILHYAGIREVEAHPSPESMQRLELCTNILEKFTFISSYFLSGGELENRGWAQRKTYCNMLTLGSAVFKHALFHHAPITDRPVSPKLVRFSQDLTRRVQELARLVDKREIELEVSPQALNEILWKGANREDAEELSELLTRDEGMIMLEHHAIGGEKRELWVRGRMDEMLRHDKRGRDGLPIQYTDYELKFFHAIDTGDESNAIVQVVRLMRQDRFSFADRPLQTVVEETMKRLLDFMGNAVYEAWRELLGEIPPTNIRTELVMLALMNESQRAKYFKIQRHEVYDKADLLAARRTGILRSRAYWEQGPHASLFVEGKERLVARFERMIPPYVGQWTRLDMLRHMVQFEKVKLLMQDYNVVTPEEYEALEAVVEYMQQPDVVAALFNNEVRQPQQPKPNGILSLSQLSSKRP